MVENEEEEEQEEEHQDTISDEEKGVRAGVARMNVGATSTTEDGTIIHFPPIVAPMMPLISPVPVLFYDEHPVQTAHAMPQQSARARAAAWYRGGVPIGFRRCNN